MIQMLRRRDGGLSNQDRDLTTLAFFTAACMLLLQIILLLKYFVHLTATRRATPQARRRKRTWSLTETSLTADQLLYRMQYLARRFAPHAPHYQFAIWLRQGVLTLITYVPEFFGINTALDYVTVVTNLNPWLAQT